MPEILSLATLVGLATLITVEHNVLIAHIYLTLTAIHARSRGAYDSLRQACERIKRLTAVDMLCNLYDTLLTHPIGYEVSTTINEQRRTQTVLPIIVMRQTAHRSLNASGYDGGTRKQSPEYVGVHYSRIVGTRAMTPSRGVGIVTATTTSSSVMIDHGVHGSGRDPKEQARCTELAEIAQVVLPVGLRDYSHPVTGSL